MAATVPTTADAMRLTNLFQPHYLFRPSQIARRIARSFRKADGVQDAFTPWGARLEVDSREYIGHGIVWTGMWDLPVCETLWRLLRPGDTAVDAGANIGCMTTLMSARVGARGEVFAFEPHPVIARRLALNLERLRELRDAAPVRNVAAALSAARGTATLAVDAVFDINQGAARVVRAGEAEGLRAVAEVPMVRLDEEVGDRRVRVLKADVEGHEAQLFAGTEALFRRRAITHIVYEDQAGGGSAVHDFLERHGFTVFALGWRLLGPVIAGRRVSLTHPGETPDFVATLDPDELRRVMAPRGWTVLRAKSSRGRGARPASSPG